jgi:hypothetical protein
MASASSTPYPSSRESTNASFEGSSSMGPVPVGFEEPPRVLSDSTVKDQNDEPEKGSEWEPIKILFEGDRGSNKMNMASNTRL